MDELPTRVRVLVEVPRGSFVKREAGRGIEYLAPVPCPFNYGCVPDRPAPDGDPADAVVLGPRRPAGTACDVAVWGVVRFVDDGRPDDKLVCGDAPPGRAGRVAVAAFFRVYAPARALLNRARGRRGETRFRGVTWRDAPP